jgi:hypothetical protein
VLPSQLQQLCLCSPQHVFAVKLNATESAAAMAPAVHRMHSNKVGMLVRY